MVGVEGVERPTNFRTDPAIPKSGQSTDAAYKGSGFDRGHMASNDSFNYSTKSATNTFYYTNIVPQLPKVNRSLWLEAEQIERDLAWGLGSIVVDNYSIGKMDKLTDGTIVPTGLLKVISAPGLSRCFYYDQEHVVGGETSCDYFSKIVK
jgi:endonuclease G